MQTVLPLEKMSREEKLRIMEELWADLSRNEAQFESPAWHGEVLRERAEAVKAGKETFIDWEEAKKQLRNRKK
jgi:putative addiction module component (TIGR02574 family)